MSTSLDRGAHEPGWAEIILGIILSLALGAVLAAGLLIVRPVETVRELPEEPDSQKVYYIEGSRDAGRGRQAPAKRAAFVQGQTVSVTEEELNALAATPPAAKPGEPAPAPKAIDAGTPNFRIREGEVQISAPVTVNVAGLNQNLVAQGRGGFVKDGNRFVFEPSELYLGSLRVERVPFLSGYVLNKLLAAQPLPEDIAEAWGRVTSITVEGNTLTIAQ